MDQLLKGKVAVVTGASRGIGYGIAHKFASEGASVAICSVNAKTGAAAAEKIAAETGAKAFYRQADVSKSEDILAFIDSVMRQFGRIDILVNNAGISRLVNFIDTTDAGFDEMVNTNLRSTYVFMREVGKIMKEQGSGNVINISSCACKRPMDKHALYTMTKMGMLGLTRVFALEMGQYGIRCNALLPGMTATDMVLGLQGTLLNEGANAHVKQIPLGRMATVEDNANAALYLASDLSAFVTGESLVVSGGRVMSH